jgi:hypothetical protein
MTDRRGSPCCNPWRLALLFLVSGVATGFMLGKLTPGRLCRSRNVRLLPPLLFGMLAIVPPQAYVQILESVGYDGGFLNFYLTHYFAFGPQFCRPGPCVLLPTWNHLWFVAYLWAYTMALGAVLVAVPGPARRAGQAITPMFSGVMLLVLPAALLAAYRLLLLPQFPSTHALFGDWYNHALVRCFCSGFWWRAPTASGSRSRISAGRHLGWPLRSLYPAWFCDTFTRRANRCLWR